MDHHHALRMLAVRDRAFFTLVDQDEQDNVCVSELTAQQAALARLAALVALDGAQVSYMHVVEDALSAGVSVDDLVGTLIAVMPSTGADRVVSAAPKLALAVAGRRLHPSRDRRDTWSDLLWDGAKASRTRAGARHPVRVNVHPDAAVATMKVLPGL
jgi:4-carboxymuconolactone decarboxylase